MILSVALTASVVLGSLNARAAEILPLALDTPDRGVVCNRAAEFCYDRYGPSVGLTEAFCGKPAADRLLAILRSQPVDDRPGATFAPTDGVLCIRETGPCFVHGEPNSALTAVLYGSRQNGR